MKFRYPKNWSNSVDLKGLLFFTQVMEELTFEFSIDSYKAPVTNAPALINECLSQIKISRKYDKGLATVKHILDELASRLNANSISRNLLNISLKKLTTFDYENHEDIFRKLQVLKREINAHAYAMKSMELLKEVIQENKKSEIYFLSRELTTTLLNFGMSASHIKTTMINHFFKNKKDIDSIDHIDGFFKKVYPHLHKTTVCFKIKSTAQILDDKNINLFGINISEELPDSFKKFAKKNNFDKLSEEQKFVIVDEFRAYDSFSATEKAIAKISRLHDFFGIYHHKDTFKLEDKALVEQCCTNGLKVVGKAPNRMQFISDSRPDKASKKLDYLLNNNRLVRGKDRNKFFRAVEFHGLSIAGDVLENQLLNIWISLETLSPKDARRSISDSVVKGALPFLGLMYFQNIIDRLLFDIVQWNRHELTRALKAVSAPKEYSIQEKLLFLISNPSHETALAELFSKMDKFELLRFRTYQLHMIFSDKQKMVAFLNSHQIKVEWQLRRIYRTRNRIVHSGNTPAFTNRLIENAHTYFDQIFNSCCEFSCGINGLYTLDECFDFAKWKFEEYQQHLNKMPNTWEEHPGNILWHKKGPPSKMDILPAKS